MFTAVIFVLWWQVEHEVASVALKRAVLMGIWWSATMVALDLIRDWWRRRRGIAQKAAG